MPRVEELLQTLSLEELAILVIAVLQIENGGATLPIGTTEDEPFFVAINGEEAEEVREYWEGLFGDITSEEALELVEQYRQYQQFEKLKDHERAYERSRENQEKITQQNSAAVQTQD